MNKTDELVNVIDEGALLEQIITEDTYIPAASPEAQPEWKKKWESGASKRAMEKADSQLVQELLVKGTSQERYDASDSIIELLYHVDIHEIGLDNSQAGKLSNNEIRSLGAAADTPQEELQYIVDKNTIRQLRAKLAEYHVSILHDHEIENLPEAERLKREYRKLKFLYDDAKDCGEYYKEQYGEAMKKLQSPAQRIGRQKKNEARDMLKHNPQGLADLLSRMKYGGEQYGCGLCEILKLAEWGSCRQNYETCRDCVDSYLEAYYTRGDWREEKCVKEGNEAGLKTSYQCYADFDSKKTLNGTWLYRNFIEFKLRKSYLMPMEYYPADENEGESVFFRDHDQDSAVMYVFIVSEKDFLITAIETNNRQQIVPPFLENQKADERYSDGTWFNCLDPQIWSEVIANRPESAELARSFYDKVTSCTEKGVAT